MIQCVEKVEKCMKKQTIYKFYEFPNINLSTVVFTKNTLCNIIPKINNNNKVIIKSILNKYETK